MSDPSTPSSPERGLPEGVRVVRTRRRFGLAVTLILLLGGALVALGWRTVYRPAQLRLEALHAQLATLQTQVDTLVAAQGELAGGVTALRLKVAALEQTTDRLYARASSQDTAWRLAEAEHLLRIAADLATLRADVDAAGHALAGADQALAAIRDPALTPVRAGIAQLRLQLGAYPRPDFEGARLALRALDSSLALAPLAGDPARAGDGTARAPATGWWQRVQAALREVFVLRHDAGGSAAPGPQAGFFVREMLHLRFAQAELALDARNHAAWRARLGDLDALLTHYRGDAPGVAHARREFSRLAALDFGAPLPDLAPPLRALEGVLEAQRVAGGAP